MTMGALHTMVLVSDEVITTQRWQMLNNHERYATETGCRTQLMLNMLGAEDSLDGPCERCDNCGVTPLYELRARRALRAESTASQETQERELGPHERRQLALKAWRAELVELLMGGFYDQAPSRRPLEALTTHVNAYPPPLKASATSTHEGWRELEGRTRGLLEEQPEDLFFNMALCLSLGAQGGNRVRSHPACPSASRREQ